MGRFDLLGKILRHFRSRRMRLFEKTFQISAETRVLDVGGSASIWDYSTVRPRLTILNFPSAIQSTSADLDWVAGDGRMLPFGDAAFDIAFSNSVIEHVGDEADQQAFAKELARVARHYWVQTPNRRFPVETHMMLPFIHYLPKGWQRRIVERFTIWQLLVRPSEEQRLYYIDHFLNELKLLGRRDLQRLFPEATILSEQFLGLVKSNIAVRR
jgi:Methyltransferase domain